MTSGSKWRLPMYATVLVLAGPKLTFACDLAIAIDKTASMNTIRPGTGNTRCKDSARYAEAVFNNYRCGQSSACSVTTSAARNIHIDQRIDATDPVFDDPANGCKTTSSKRVNVFTFNSLTPGSIVSATANLAPTPSNDPGWVNLSNDADADAVHALLVNLQGDCTGLTPIADVLCGFQIPTPLGDPSVARKKVVLITDFSNEIDTSSRVCLGGDDTTPPFDATSWEGMTLSVLTGTKWCIDSEVLGPGFPVYFNALASMTGCHTAMVTDSAPIAAPPSGTSAPWSPRVWLLYVLALLLLLTGYEQLPAAET